MVLDGIKGAAISALTSSRIWRRSHPRDASNVGSPVSAETSCCCEDEAGGAVLTVLWLLVEAELAEEARVRCERRGGDVVARFFVRRCLGISQRV